MDAQRTATLEIRSASGVRELVLEQRALAIGRPGSAPRADLELEQAGAGTLRITPVPPRFEHAGARELPLLNGKASAGGELGEQDELVFGALRLRLRTRERAALEELESPGASSLGASAGAAAIAPLERTSWLALRAGIAIEQNLVPPELAQRWQRSVSEGSFDAQELGSELERVALPPGGGERVAERAQRLARDLVMEPLARQRSPGARRARARAHGALAFLLVQAFSLLALAAILLVAAAVLHLKGWRFDPWLERITAWMPR